jgi:hypothetical protein
VLVALLGWIANGATDARVANHTTNLTRVSRLWLIFVACVARKISMRSEQTIAFESQPNNRHSNAKEFT